VVVLGDAAHTAHFSIGSGTKLAMEDSIALVDALRRQTDVSAALNDYELERQPVVERFQEAALESSGYFEHVSRYAGFEPKQFAFNLLTRSRRITYVNLTQRDPELIRQVDAWFASRAKGSPDGRLRLSPPPMFVEYRVRDLVLANRVVAQAGAELQQPAGSGAGLVISELVAVTPEGRITPETPVMDRAYQEQLRSAVEHAHQAGTPVGLQLGHAGRRGSMRPRSDGVDRPLRQGWRLLAPSPIAYTPRSMLPREMSARDIAHLVQVFAAAARAAAGCSVDVLELNMAHGYLLASFISPLTNQRRDEYGGKLENRLRFPLEVLDAVREACDRPLAVRISPSDDAPGGLEPEEAVGVASQLKAHGADLIHPVSGQTVWEGHPDYRRLFGVPLSDRIRNEAGIATIASGNIVTTDDVNTVLAAGRADLCLLEMSLDR
jgi:anthraniloyl-CoA monooxygenase